jgi:hypothetical protein
MNSARQEPQHGLLGRDDHHVMAALTVGRARLVGAIICSGSLRGEFPDMRVRVPDGEVLSNEKLVSSQMGDRSSP